MSGLKRGFIFDGDRNVDASESAGKGVPDVIMLRYSSSHAYEGLTEYEMLGYERAKTVSKPSNRRRDHTNSFEGKVNAIGGDAPDADKCTSAAGATVE